MATVFVFAYELVWNFSFEILKFQFELSTDLVFIFIYFLQIPAVYPLSEQRSNNKNSKSNSRSLRSDTSIENSNKSNELVIENPERDTSTSGVSTTNNFAVLFANTASVETLTHWAKSDLLLPYIAELRTFWLGAAKRPFKLRLRALDSFLSDIKFDSDSAADPADPFLDIYP